MFEERTTAESRRSFLNRLHLDGPLLIGLLILSGFGLFILFSAGDQDTHLIVKQLIRLGVAFTTMVVLAQIPPNTLKRWTPWLFAIGIILLVAVLIIGTEGKGAKRWLSLGFVRIQPSELLKLALPMMVAWFLAEKKLPPNGKSFLISCLIIAIPVYLIAKEPDLGTSILIASSGFAAIFLAGIAWRVLIGITALIAATAPIIWHNMREYQKDRVYTFLDPESEPLGSGYHIIQSKIAIGSGGVHGKGWLNGTQSQLDFLPERSTDFIFSVIGEEFGLVGLVLLLVIYLFIIIRSLYIAIHAQDTYTRLLAGSLSITFFVYIFVNTGMVTGLLPVVGLPLPLISYGGSSMVTLMAGFGILMSIHTHRKLLPS